MGSLSIMLQEGGIGRSARALELLELYASYYGDSADPKDVLGAVGLEAKAKANYRSLSGGEAQRLSLALTLVGRPKIAILDEPTSGVDLEGQLNIRKLIRSQADGGTTVILCSHNMEEVQELADRIGIISRGRLVALGTPKELLAGSSDLITLRTEGAIDHQALAQHLGTNVEMISTTKYALNCDANAELISRIATWLADCGQPINIDTTGARLDDIYFSLTGGGDVSPTTTTSAGEDT